MKKNIVKAKIYSIVGKVIYIIAAIEIISLMMLGAFIRVYPGNPFVLGNQTMRYIIYVVLAVILYLGIKLSAYGESFLNKKLKRKAKHH